MVKLRTRPPLDDVLVGTARTDRRTTSLVPRLRRGDIAVLDQLDLDRTTALALVEAGVAAVLNRSSMISGRFPALGAEVLLSAGITVVEDLTATTPGRDVLTAIPDGRRVALGAGRVVLGEEVVAEGRVLTAAGVTARLTAAETGMTAQLFTLTHSSVEFLRREQALLLNGEGVPRLATRLRGRPVVVVAHGVDAPEELRAIRRYLREVRPVVIATGEALDLVRSAGLRPDIVVLDSRADDVPPARLLRAARDVVATEPPGAGRSAGGSERFDRIGLRPRSLQTTATPADAALLLADAGDARPVVAVGCRGTIADFLDGTREGLGSGYVTRLKLGPRLVDARAVPMLYSGQLRARHAYLAVLVGLVAVCAAIATTHVGHEWAVHLGEQVGQLWSQLRSQLRGVR